MAKDAAQIENIVKSLYAKGITSIDSTLDSVARFLDSFETESDCWFPVVIVSTEKKSLYNAG